MYLRTLTISVLLVGGQASAMQTRRLAYKSYPPVYSEKTLARHGKQCTVDCMIAQALETLTDKESSKLEKLEAIEDLVQYWDHCENHLAHTEKNLNTVNIILALYHKDQNYLGSLNSLLLKVCIQYPNQWKKSKERKVNYWGIGNSVQYMDYIELKARETLSPAAQPQPTENKKTTVRVAQQKSTGATESSSSSLVRKRKRAPKVEIDQSAADKDQPVTLSNSDDDCMPLATFKSKTVKARKRPTQICPICLIPQSTLSRHIKIHEKNRPTKKQKLDKKSEGAASTPSSSPTTMTTLELMRSTAPAITHSAPNTAHTAHANTASNWQPLNTVHQGCYCYMCGQLHQDGGQCNDDNEVI